MPQYGSAPTWNKPTGAPIKKWGSPQRLEGNLTKPAEPVSTHVGGTTGVLQNPGTYEEWYKANAHKYGQPTNLGAYQDSVRARYGGSGVQPTNAGQAWNKVQHTYERPALGAQNARDVSDRLYRDPGDGAGHMKSAAGYFQGPNMTSGYAESLDPRIFARPGQMEQFNEYGQIMLRGQGNGEQHVYNTLGQFQAPGAAETNNTAVQGMMAGNNAARNFNSELRSSGFLNKNTTGGEFDYFRPELRENSYSEDLYESGNQGLNTFYDREQQKRSKRLSDQMAAMGVFGSGATARGMYELEGELGAAQARDMASLAGQADQSKLGRIGAAQSFSSAAGDEEINRYGLGMEAAYKSDESTRGNASLMNQSSQAAQALQLQRLFQGGQLGLQADAEGRQRLGLAGTFANNADGAQMARVATGANIYNMADHSRFDQGKGLADIGDQMTGRYFERMRNSSDAGLAADQEERTRANDYFSRGKELDASVLDSERFNRDTAGGVDRQDLERLAAGGDAAKESQDMFERRERYGIQDKQRLAESLSGLVASSAGKSADEQLAIQEQVIQSFMAQAGMTRALAEQKMQEMYQSMGIAVQTADSVARARAAADAKATPAPAPAPAPAPEPVNPANQSLSGY